jgi:hypothetical protein
MTKEEADKSKTSKYEFSVKDTVRGVKFSFGSANVSTPDIEPGASPTGSGQYYVYVHRDAAGHIFYVGKGRGDRAKGQYRHPSWQWYINTRLEGKYTVQIVS